MNRVYFKGLDGLRAIAAILVILGHVELIKKLLNFNNCFDNGGGFYLHLGSDAVTLFFVLSGFLITYLLLCEREMTGDISIKSFYLKRILRIWPVYYLLFVCGFGLLQLIDFSNLRFPKNVVDVNYWSGFLYNLFLMPNFSNIENPIAFQSWSIGVEEQFYLLWPILLSKVRLIKQLVIVMFIIVLGTYILRSGIYLNNKFGWNLPFVELLNHIFLYSRFDNMAIGGILAILHFTKPNINLILPIKILLLFLSTMIILKKITILYGLYFPVTAIVFAGLIFWVVKTENNIILENICLRYLGRISYGLYMYHVLGIIIAINVVISINPLFDGSGFVDNCMLYSFTLLFTLIISILSYKFIEKPVLSLKNQFL